MMIMDINALFHLVYEGSEIKQIMVGPDERMAFCYEHCFNTEMGAVAWAEYLIWAGCLVNSARVFVMLLGFCLVRHAVWLVDWRHVVHQGDGLHSFVNSAADGLADLGGSWSPGGWMVMAGLKTSSQNVKHHQKPEK